MTDEGNAAWLFRRRESSRTQVLVLSRDNNRTWFEMDAPCPPGYRLDSDAVHLESGLLC